MNGGLVSCSPATREKLRALVDADWHFVGAQTQSGVHSIHPYPAKFIPQIPRQLIEILAPRSVSVVFDPFCGSGSTLVEAQEAGYAAIGVDVNPIATLITRVKTRQTTESIHRLAKSIVKGFKRSHEPVPQIPRLDHWFAPEVQQALAQVARAICDEPNEVLRDDLRLALSSIIVRVSYQDGDTRYAAVPKTVSGELVLDLFERAAAELDKARRTRFDSLFSNEFVPARVITADILTVSPDEIGPVDLVITSPPYPNAYEYWLYHKYRMYWLGFDPLVVREAEIGARPHFFKKNHHTAADFERQMLGVFALLRSVLQPDGFVCIVVGDSKIHGHIVDNVALLERAASNQGFSLLTSVERKVPSVRKAFNPANARTTAESIVVFGKDE